MGKTTKFLSTTAIWTASAAGVVGAVGGLIEVGDYTPSDEMVADYEADIATTKENIVILTDDKDQFSTSLGEACLATVKPYAESLGHVSETDAVNDILANPSKSCGDDPTVVRQNVSDYRSVVDDLNSSQEVLTNTNRNLDEAIEARAVDSETNEFATGLISGAVLGLLGGVVHSILRIRYHNEVQPEPYAATSQDIPIEVS